MFFTLSKVLTVCLKSWSRVRWRSCLVLLVCLFVAVPEGSNQGFLWDISISFPEIMYAPSLIPYLLDLDGSIATTLYFLSLWVTVFKKLTWCTCWSKAIELVLFCMFLACFISVETDRFYIFSDYRIFTLWLSWFDLQIGHRRANISNTFSACFHVLVCPSTALWFN